MNIIRYKEREEPIGEPLAFSLRRIAVGPRRIAVGTASLRRRENVRYNYDLRFLIFRKFQSYDERKRREPLGNYKDDHSVALPSEPVGLPWARQSYGGGNR